MPETAGKVYSGHLLLLGSMEDFFVKTGEEDLVTFLFIDISRFRMNYTNI